jgi:membrane protein DedA with SNARE-associated domain
MLRDHLLAALRSGPPVLQVGAIILGTFILEDATTAIVAFAVGDGLLSMAVGLAGLYLGVSLGDFGLYWLGHLAGRHVWVQRLVRIGRPGIAGAWLKDHAAAVVFSSRFLPGLRLPTYTAFGFFGVPFRRFAVPVVLATLLWTTLLFGLCLAFGGLVLSHLGQWRWFGAGLAVIVLIVLGRRAAHLADAHE